MNYKKWYKFVIYFILIALAMIFQITFLGNFNLFFKNFNLMLAILVLLIGLTDFKTVLVYLVLSGVLMDIYSSLPFGVYLMTFFLLAIILEILFLNFFTNRSFYSLITMGIIAVIIYNIFFLLISGFSYLIGASPLRLIGASEFFLADRLWLNIFYQLTNIIIILSFAFWLINKISRRFKPTFLKR